MKQVSLGLLLLAFVLTLGQPTISFAKSGSDDDGDRVEYSDDDEDEDEDQNELEVEADVFLDTTIIKVELKDGSKTIFQTDADTEEEVIAVVVGKFDLGEAEVADALDFEIEDRSSRMGERAKLKEKKKDRIKVCRDDFSDELEVEADIFTDTTLVKVELASGTKKVFETDATSSADIIAEVVNRYDLATSTVQAVLDLEIEDRAIRAADRVIANNPADCDDDRAQVGDGNKGTSTASSSSNRESELRAQVAELQRLLNTLIRLFTERFGSL